MTYSGIIMIKTEQIVFPVPRSGGGLGIAVGIVTGYGLDRSWIRSQVIAWFFVPIQTDPKVHHPPVKRNLGLSQGVKWLGCGADYPPHLAKRLQWVGAIILLPLCGCTGTSGRDLYLYQ
jgi:hypothetical protein